MSKNINAEIGKSQFETILRMPIAWLHKGNSLFLSGELLLKRSWAAKRKIDTIITQKGSHRLNKVEERLLNTYSICSEAGFLIALAIENYLKALWLLKNKGALTSYDRLPSEIDCHDILDLSKRTGIILEKSEFKILNTLYASIVWYGRYPIPKKIAQNSAFWVNKTTMSILFTEYPGRYKLPKSLSSIINKIHEEFKRYPEKDLFLS